MASVGTIESMYQEFKDIAEFRLVYIREAHAADGRSPVRYAIEKEINEAQNFDDRCKTAEMLISEKELTLPFLIDDMDNTANDAYRAWPDRVFLVRKDGRLGVAGDRGPWGFRPGLDAVNEWLTEFRESGEQPALPEGALEAALEKERQQQEAEKNKDKDSEDSEDSDSTADADRLDGGN